ncbi:MAG: hypothetical protein B6U97_03715 [Candidatus Altiarchaeales archaeon ex4484_96]|nr:MAG: hypothetical protein B6U97_03715 [Candidatus Altiarchaeales archaeon ex4484_96]
MMDNKHKIMLSLVLLSGIILRLPYLELMPSWMWDEGVNMNISWNLASGRAQWFTLTYPFIPHPPLFFMISAFLLKLLGNHLIYMRALTALYGVWTVFLLYLVGKEAFDTKTGLFAAFLFAIYPWAIFYNRGAFANNQLMLLTVLTLYLYLRYNKIGKQKWIIYSACTASMAVLTEYTGIALVVSLAILTYKGQRDLIKKIFIILVAPLLLFTVIMLYLMPDAFIHDLLFTLNRFSNAILGLIILLAFISVYRFIPRDKITPLKEKTKLFYLNIARYALFYGGVASEEETIERIGYNLKLAGSILFLLTLYLSLQPLSWQGFYTGLDLYWLGLFGYLVIKPKKTRKQMLAFCVPLFIIIAGFGRLDHMIMPFYPFFALGLALLFKEVYLILTSAFKQTASVRMIVLAFLIIPLAYMGFMDYQTFVEGINPSVPQENMGARLLVSEYVNEQVTPDDLVLADSHFLRFIGARVSVILQAVAYEGQQILYMSGDYGLNRFTFNCSYKKAKIIIIADGYMPWLKENCPQVAEYVSSCKLSRIDSFRVYECGRLGP